MPPSRIRKAVPDIHDLAGELAENDRVVRLGFGLRRVGVTIANMSVLKNGHAKAIRFNTLTAICRELECKPGDILDYVPADPE